jgi:uncharacterized protein YqjF (DUF2071 family)
MEGGKVIDLERRGPSGLSQPQAPHRRALMRQTWDDVSFLHWDVDPDIAQSLLPPGLDVDVYDGRAWVGLVPFHMRRIAPAGLPPIPYFGSFPETNVRTYVTSRDGTPGVWFHSLEASRLAPVGVARALYGLPYFYASMHIRRTGRRVRYNTLRRWPGPRGAGGQIAIDVGDPIENPTELARFLTSRWRLFTHRRGDIYSAEIRHEPWPLHSASISQVDTSLVTEAGYGVSGAPHLLYSPRVHVEAYLPRRLGTGGPEPH